MTTLTAEQRALGRANANVTLGSSRRDFLKAAAAAPALGAFYFGYTGSIKSPVRAAIIGTGNEGCQAMIHEHNRDYVDILGYCDIRPSSQARAVREFTAHAQYGAEAAKKLKSYADADAMINDPDVEMIIIALPLWLHAPIALKAMQAGKHVFCEKLMAHSIGECKAMCRVARDKNKLLAIGHQRHYSTLYDNANYLVQNGFLGDIRHIRALWHRNNACPKYVKDKNGDIVYDAKGNPELQRDDNGNVLYFDGWKPDILEADKDVDYAKYGYKSLDELVRWRLYNRTGAGLMAELGSHQMDAASIFLGKIHPLSVQGIGGTFFYHDGREVDDHVYVQFEFPTPAGPKDKDRVVVTYSSINTNAFENYGELVYGTRGTMIVESEAEMLLYKEANKNVKGDEWGRTTNVTVETKGEKPVLEASHTVAGPSGKSVPGTVDKEVPSRGYREELEHFAFCIRNGDAKDYYGVLSGSDEEAKHVLLPRCRGEVAMADAIIALTSNIAMREGRKIVFEPSWFDYKSDETPDDSKGDMARA